MSPRPARPGAKLVVIRPGDGVPTRNRRSVRGQARSERDPAEPRPDGSAPTDLLILHIGSGRLTPEAMTAAAKTVFEPRGLTHRTVTVEAGRGAEASVRRHVARAIREGCTRIVAAGGDGTVSMVAQCLARRRKRDVPVSLGILPGGTTNVLARELGIPLDLEQAMAVIAEAGQVVELDAILVGRRYVFTQVGLGPDALMIRDTTRERQEKLGRLAYVLTFVKRAFGFRPRWFTLRLDGVVVRERAWQIVAANVGTVGAPPFTWGPRIDPTDGILDLCIFNVNRKRDFGKLLWRALTSRHRRDGNARFYRVKDRAVVESSQPVLVQGDGEIIGRTPVTLRLVPAVLRILVAKPVAGVVPTEPAAAAAEAAPLAEDRGVVASEEPAAASATAAAPATASAPAAASTPAVGPNAAPEAAPTVTEDVALMIGERSTTWPLQGIFRHPLAAIEAYDAAIFLHLNNISFGKGVDRGLEALSRFLHYGEGWAVVVLLILFVNLRQGLEAAVVALPALWATMITVNVVLKPIFRRRRPFIAFVKARVIGTRPRDFSFPSGHAAAGFAGAVLLGMFLPRWAPLFYLFAIAVSFSRIYLGVHYPSDVLMGAFAGSVLAVVYRALIHLLVAAGA
ncbi:MAG TPA: phosphatase PAP2 family protein [Candidatus Eisenbacteria bacterium]|nr:phosphatase PAP2 family protein [Candidatus Eisenbacteria bacterium]